MNNGSEHNSQNLQTPTEGLSLQTDVVPDPGLGQSSALAGGANVVQQAPGRTPWLRIAGVALLVVALGAGFFLVRSLGGQTGTGNTTGTASSRIKSQTVALAGLSDQLANTSVPSTSTLTVNGKVVVSNSLVLQPTAQPTNAVAGQIYYDQTSNNIAFYNGTQFLTLQGSTVNTQITNSSVTNIFGAAAGGVAANGTEGTIAMFTGNNKIGDSVITQSGSTVTVASSSSFSANNVQVGTSASNVTVGSTGAGSATTLQAGTGNLTVATGADAGATGSISIKTGDSSTTASGNITIDAGVGIVDGEVVADKTFEDGLDNMNAWFGNTVAQSSTQAHSGIYSLAETGNSAFWGVIETLPGTAVTAGHQYYFSTWVRAGSTPRTITGRAVWNGAAANVTLTAVTDSTTGWTEMTGLGAAPGGAASVYFEFQSTGAVGEVHYFDDMTVTDLSSASAISAISIGATNAKIVTIGNINQIGATSIYGGSGISLNGGAGPINLNGGVLSLTGNAASNLNTTSGALTITSAAAATWSVGQASTGVGGDLTLRAGAGGSDTNNNGGDLILQGGRQNGTGLPGSVLVKPQTDTTDTFQIQSSTATPLLTADTTNMKITVAGTDTVFATLALDNAHFTSTQTTAPTVGIPANCGTAPTAAVAAGSTDTAGAFTITTGTGGSSSTCDATITFHRAYGAAPKSIIVVGKGNATSAARQIYVSAVAPTTFTTSFAVSTAGADSTPYSFSYWIVE